MYFREAVLTVAALAAVGCSTAPKVADATDPIRSALKQQGYNNVSVKDDTDKSVVTLGGHVASDQEKMAAEALAKSFAVGQVVADEIIVEPPGQERIAKDVTSDLDKGIENNLTAALRENGWQQSIDFSVKSGVVKLTGAVDSQSLRKKVQDVAATVPNVQQVVNELQVKNQKATSTN